ncbi:MAG: type IV secretory system conjugative DNA transfer family protein [Acidiferrobacterales bacterium]
MTGVTSVTQATRQYCGSRLDVLLSHVMTNDQTVQRSLLTPDETLRLPDTDALLFVAGHPVIYCQKIRYYEDPVFAARAALSPA